MLEALPDLASKAAARLRGLASRVTARRPIAVHSVQFDLEWLASPEVLAQIDLDLKMTVTQEERIIYEFTASEPATYDGLRIAFESRPLTDPIDGRKLNYSRMIDPCSPGALYVGSGRNLRARIGQHLGRIGGPGTFSMRLALWATEVPGAIELKYWLYERDIDVIELEALEHELWDARKPLLGKRSGK